MFAIVFSQVLAVLFQTSIKPPLLLDDIYCFGLHMVQTLQLHQWSHHLCSLALFCSMRANFKPDHVQSGGFTPNVLSTKISRQPWNVSYRSTLDMLGGWFFPPLSRECLRSLSLIYLCSNAHKCSRVTPLKTYIFKQSVTLELFRFECWS